MLLLRFLPTILCAILFAAHALRADLGLVAAGLVLGLPLLLLWRRRFVPLLLRVLLAVGALEWIGTALAAARTRAALGQPATRLWLILGGVAAFNLLAAALLGGPRVRDWFDRR